MKKLFLFVLSFMIMLATVDTHQAHASLFGKIKDDVEKEEKHIKKKSKHHKLNKHNKHNQHHKKKGNPLEHALGEVTKDVEHVAEHEVTSKLDKVQKALSVATKSSGLLSGEVTKVLNKLPGGKLKTCSMSAIKVAQGIEQMVGNSQFPKDFCPNLNKFQHAGCTVDGQMLKLLGGKIKVVKKFEELNEGKCSCLHKIFNIYGHAVRGNGLNPNTCKDAEKAVGCCKDMLSIIPGMKSMCTAISKAVKDVDSPCKKVLGTCPVLAVNIAAAIAEVVVAEEEDVELILDNAVSICKNIELLDSKNCCKMSGPLQKKCKIISNFDSRVCQTLNCPLEMAQFIKELEMSGGKNPDCEKLNEIKNSNCAAAAKYLPGSIKGVVNGISKKFHEIIETVDDVCEDVEEISHGIGSKNSHHKSSHHSREEEDDGEEE